MWQGGGQPLPLPVSLYGRADTPWILVPRVGLIASRGTLDSDVLTLRADLSMAVQAGEGSFNATEHWLLGVLLAPVDTGYRARLGATYDRLIHDRVRLRTSLDLYTHGAQPDRLRALGKVGIEIAAWRSSAGRWRRVGLGVGWLNSDTYAVNADRQRVRSNDFYLFDIVLSPPRRTSRSGTLHCRQSLDRAFHPAEFDHVEVAADLPNCLQSLLAVQWVSNDSAFADLVSTHLELRFYQGVKTTRSLEVRAHRRKNPSQADELTSTTPKLGAGSRRSGSAERYEFSDSPLGILTSFRQLVVTYIHGINSSSTILQQDIKAPVEAPTSKAMQPSSR